MKRKCEACGIRSENVGCHTEVTYVREVIGYFCWDRGCGDEWIRTRLADLNRRGLKPDQYAFRINTG